MIMWFALYDLNVTLFISLLNKTLSEKNCDPIFGHNPPVENHCSGNSAINYAYLTICVL